MEASLEDRASNDAYQLEDKELNVAVPLTRCLQDLKEKHNTIANIHRERSEQVKSKVSHSSCELALRHGRTRPGA